MVEDHRLEQLRHAALLCAVDPAGLGAVLRCAGSGGAEAWLDLLRAALPAGTPWRRLPSQVPDSRLMGGLDLGATLAAGRPIADPGLLVETDGGVLVLPQAERLAPETAARLAMVHDAAEVVTEREGIAGRRSVRLGCILLDEGVASDESPPAALMDRLAFILDVQRFVSSVAPPHVSIVAARALLPRVTTTNEAIAALCTTAAMLGIPSLRAPLLALRTARAAAALAGRTYIEDSDLALAAVLVLAPRATRAPAEDAAEPLPDESMPATEEQSTKQEDGRLPDALLEAALANLPADLLASLAADRPGRRGVSGQAGQTTRSLRRGRPAGTRVGSLLPGARLNLVETLRAAVPWQGLRRRQTPLAGPRILVRRSDFRIQRFQERMGTTTIFVVDASGSAALGRLAEAKGAVELLLAECYRRRDQVAVIGFRGSGAELLLPPTASLVRAKRALAGLPGGGGTPLASALEAATDLALAENRKGRTPVVLVLTDGRANVARDGQGGRARAEAEALAAGTAFGALDLSALLVDTSPRPQLQARRIAEAMRARYLPLPMADSQRLQRAAQSLITK
jgi:magnesium chelatase subunit D